jgi:hypothetical protein
MVTTLSIMLDFLEVRARVFHLPPFAPIDLFYRLVLQMLRAILFIGEVVKLLERCR